MILARLIFFNQKDSIFLILLYRFALQ